MEATEDQEFQDFCHEYWQKMSEPERNMAQLLGGKPPTVS